MTQKQAGKRIEEIDEQIKDMQAHDVSDTIQKGGTVLYTARCKEMRTEEGVRRAAENCPASLYLIDALQGLGLNGEERGIIHGDAVCYSIAAASIIAKVTRDRQMEELDRLYPGYHFQQHKGYGTAQHIAALKELGPCPAHRRSFIKNFV